MKKERKFLKIMQKSAKFTIRQIVWEPKNASVIVSSQNTGESD